MATRLNIDDVLQTTSIAETETAYWSANCVNTRRTMAYLISLVWPKTTQYLRVPVVFTSQYWWFSQNHKKSFGKIINDLVVSFQTRTTQLWGSTFSINKGRTSGAVCKVSCSLARACRRSWVQAPARSLLDYEISTFSGPFDDTFHSASGLDKQPWVQPKLAGCDACFVLDVTFL